MASSIKKTDVAENEVLANLIPTQAQIDMVDKLDASFNKLAEGLKKDLKFTKDSLAAMQKQSEAQGKLNTITNQKIATDKQRLRLETQLRNSKTAEGLATEKLKIQISNQRKETKLLAKEELGLLDDHQKLTAKTNEAQKKFKALAAQFSINSKQAKAARREFEKLDSKTKRQ